MFLSPYDRSQEEPKEHIVLGIQERNRKQSEYTLCIVLKIEGKKDHTLFTAKLHSKEQVSKKEAFLPPVEQEILVEGKGYSVFQMFFMYDERGCHNK